MKSSELICESMESCVSWLESDSDRLEGDELDEVDEPDEVDELDEVDEPDEVDERHTTSSCGNTLGDPRILFSEEWSVNNSSYCGTLKEGVVWLDDDTAR
jgi:hypothetical protein